MRLYQTIALVVALLLMSCDQMYSSDDSKDDINCRVNTHGNNIYEFHCIRDEFILALNNFLTKNNDLEVADTTAASEGDRGYIVTFRYKAEKVENALTKTDSLNFRVFLGNKLCATLPLNTTKPVNLLELCSNQ